MKNKKRQGMQLNTYEQLEACQTRIYNALWSNNRMDKECAFSYVWAHILDIKTELSCRWYAWSLLGKNRYYGPARSLSTMKDFSLDLNLRFSIEVINERMRSCSQSPVSSYAAQMLFFHSEPLQDDTLLYAEKREDGSEELLKVSDFLAVLGHAKRFAETKLNADFGKYCGALTAIKTVELAINHKQVDKPINKTLHIVNDILTEYAKSISKDKETKRAATGMSLLVDLAIDFLVKG